MRQNSVFKFLRNCHTVFCRGRKHLIYLFFIPSNKQKCPTSSGLSLTFLMFLAFVWLFWNIHPPGCEEHYAALISISPIVYEVKLLFICLLATYLPPLEQCLHKSSATWGCLFCRTELEEHWMFWILIPCRKRGWKLLSDMWTIFFSIGTFLLKTIFFVYSFAFIVSSSRPRVTMVLRLTI